MTDHEELRRLATAATPGPWTIHTEEVCSPIVAAMELSKLVHGSVFVPVLPMVVGSNGLATAVTGCGPTSVANAAYIAAASPDVVLALLADFDALRTRLAEVEKDAARYRWLRTSCIYDVQESMDGPGHKQLMFVGKIYPDWRFAIDHIGLDAAIDAAMGAQA